MYNEHRALGQFLLTGRRHTHAHTQKNWTPSGLYFGRAWPGCLPASCGLVELVRWRDSNPPPTTQHQAPGTRNDATDASQHGNGPDENASRQDEASSLSPSFFTTGQTFSSRWLATSYPSPPPWVEGTTLRDSPPDWTRRLGGGGGVSRRLGGPPPEEAP